MSDCSSCVRKLKIARELHGTFVLVDRVLFCVYVFVFVFESTCILANYRADVSDMRHLVVCGRGECLPKEKCGQRKISGKALRCNCELSTSTEHKQLTIAIASHNGNEPHQVKPNQSITC